MGTVIDSSVLIALERAEHSTTDILRRRGSAEIVLSAITVSELLHGVHRAKQVAQRARREAFVEGILAAVPVVPFDVAVARVHARLWAQLASKGQPVGAHDLIIAATALSLDYRVATTDKRSFPKIVGLRVESW